MNIAVHQQMARYIRYGPELVRVIKGWVCHSCAQKDQGPEHCKLSACRVFMLLRDVSGQEAEKTDITKLAAQNAMMLAFIKEAIDNDAFDTLETLDEAETLITAIEDLGGQS